MRLCGIGEPQSWRLERIDLASGDLVRPKSVRPLQASNESRGETISKGGRSSSKTTKVAQTSTKEIVNINESENENEVSNSDLITNLK